MATSPTSLFRPALLHTWRAGYHRADLQRDLGAGLLVGVISLPLSMGLAIASGARPEQGLVTAIIGGLIVSILGGSRVQIGGPAGAFVGLCAAGVAQFGYGGLAVATLISGLLLIAMGVARLGKAITYIPIPVVIGFTTGIAVTIASTQVASLLGLPNRPFEYMHERIWWLWQQRAAASWLPMFIGLVTVTVIMLVRRWRPLWPGALIALVAVTAVTTALGLESGDHGLATIRSAFGDIPHGVPWPSLPTASLELGLGPDWHFTELWRKMLPILILAGSIALLGAIESLLSAVVADGMTGDRHDSNTELIAQGVANLTVPFFGGLPVTGVIARTSTNIRAGARSPVAGIVHSLTILFIMLALASLVLHIPLACLAGVLLVVCWGMAELRHWPHILGAGRSDAFLLPVAFILTVLLGLTWAVGAGVLLAMLFFVKRIVDTTQVERMGSDNGAEEEAGLVRPPGIDVFEVRGPFFFGAATLIRDLDGMLGAGTTALVLRLRNVPFIDATAAFSLRELAASCRRRHIRLVLSDVHTRPLADLDRHDLLAEIGRERVTATLEGAFAVLANEATATPAA